MSAAKSAQKKAVPKPVSAKVPGTAIDVDLDELLFDERNPRLPEELTDRTQDNLLAYIAREYHPLEIAKSVSAPTGAACAGSTTCAARVWSPTRASPTPWISCVRSAPPTAAGRSTSAIPA